MKKSVDNKNRIRSKTVSFRVSPEELKEIERLVNISGMYKQEYIMHRLQNTDMIIQPNTRIIKSIKKELREIISVISEKDIDSGVVEDIRSLITVLL